jgi:glycosyltransferase involved in cell wall biosynthesis
MPAFNAEKYIALAIASVRDQTLKDWELVVVDDGSIDQTAQIIATYAETDNRISLVRQKNSGNPAHARNNALRQAKGRYICFLDADDLYASDRLSVCLGVFNEYPSVAIVFNDFGRFRSDVQEADRYLAEKGFPQRYVTLSRKLAPGLVIVDSQELSVLTLSKFSPIHTCAVMIDREKIGPESLRFREDIKIGEDVDLWMRIIENRTVAYVDERLSFYRKHGQSITERRVKFYLDTVRFRKEHYFRIRHSLSQEQNTTCRRKIGSNYFTLASELEEQQRYVHAVGCYLVSFAWRQRLAPLIALLKCNPVGRIARGAYRRFKAIMADVP